MFLAELCTMDDVLEGFVGQEKDSTSELGFLLHTSATGLLVPEVEMEGLSLAIDSKVVLVRNVFEA